MKNNKKMIHKFFKSYNQITLDNDVTILSKSEIDKYNENEVKYMVTFKKQGKGKRPDIDPPKWFITWANKINQNILDLKDELKQDILDLKTELKQDISNLNSRLDNIVKLNNLIE